jgi:hypothetical protein
MAIHGLFDFDFSKQEVVAADLVVVINELSPAGRFGLQLHNVSLGKLIAKRLPMRVTREPDQIEYPVPGTKWGKQESEG